MKIRTKFVWTLFAMCFLFVYSTALLAEDAVQAAPNNYKVLLENDKVRVLEFSGKKGDKIPMHTHPNYVTYFLTDGKATFTSGDGKTTEATMKKGETMWHPAESHAVEIHSEAHVLIVELKQ